MFDNKKRQLLAYWAGEIVRAADSGVLGGKRIQLAGAGRNPTIEAVIGPRAGALELHVGLASGTFKRVLAADDFALHRQFIPWRFTGQPAVYMSGRFVRLEAGWPDELSEKNITLASLGQHPRNGGRWIAGKNEAGGTVTLGVGDEKPHFLFAGWTGSGKTWALRSALVQLAQDPTNQIVLIDGKYGDGLGPLVHLPGVVGPVATDVESARRALSWVVGEMVRRYETGDRSHRLIVAIDEIQELTGRSGDPLITEMVRKLASQGRGARIHLLVGTQHPTQGALTDPSIKRNLVARVALKTEDYKSSEVAVGGSTPRADHLLGAGDAYAITPSASHRVQIAYIPTLDMERMLSGNPLLPEWPGFDPEAGGALPDAESAGSFTGQELAVSLIQAHKGGGRPTLVKLLRELGLPGAGSSRADRLLKLGRQIRDFLNDQGFDVKPVEQNGEDE